MKKLKLAVALLISIAFGTTVEILHQQNHTLISQLNQKVNELDLTKTELKQTRLKLTVAENKLGFLDSNKTPVQVTAYTAAPTFMHGTGLSHSVQTHVLPEDKVIYVALSPPAQSKLRAKRNDYIILVQKNTRRKILAKFVDTTDPSEQRAIVDVLFASKDQAKLWGRRFDYSAVNISMNESPFHRVLGSHEDKTAAPPTP